MDYIPLKEYREIHAKMPILCVDAVIADKGEVLLLRRNDPPDKDKWWIPGGRVRKNETLSEAVLRIVKEETGLEVLIEGVLGHLDLRFKEDPFDHGRGTHTVSLVFACSTQSREVKLGGGHSKFVWWNGNRFLSDVAGPVSDLIKSVCKPVGAKR